MGTEFDKLCARVFWGNLLKPQTKQIIHTASTLAFYILNSQILKKMPIRKSVPMYQLIAHYLL